MPVLNEQPVVGTITSAAGQVAFNINGLNNVGLFMVLTGVTAANFVFEASIDSTDGVNGNWFSVLGTRSNLTSIESTSGTLSATPAYGWVFSVVCFNYFRVRATAGTFGTAQIIASPSEGVSPALFPASGRVTTASATARTDGQLSPLNLDGQGKLIVNLFSTNELTWQSTAAAGAPITTATTTLVKNSVGGFRQYVTALQLVNNSATGTEIALQDTAGTPATLWRSFVGPNAVRDIQFPTPLRTGTGTSSGVSLVTVTAGASIWWAAQGFIGY